MKNQKGFTLIELVLVITILGILAVAALPQFINITAQANDSAMEGVVGSVRVGIGNQIAQNLANGGTGTPPASLDAVASGQTASDQAPFFTTVVQNGVADTHWSKGAATTIYVYTDNAGNTTRFDYTAASGNFAQP